MQEPDGTPEETETSPFRQPTEAEQRMGLGCVVFVIGVMFLVILIGLLLVF